jgi:hypothetical protein
MSHDILINLDDLLHCRSVERSRLEFKEGWDDNIRDAVVRTVSAFANDLLNLKEMYKKKDPVHKPYNNSRQRFQYTRGEP